MKIILNKMADFCLILKKIIGLTLSKMDGFWLILKKIIGLNLSKIADFQLFLNKMKNECFFAESHLKKQKLHYRK